MCSDILANASFHIISKSLIGNSAVDALSSDTDSVVKQARETEIHFADFSGTPKSVFY
jgi:hypothetical protein